MTIRVSVLLPVRDASTTLAAAIASLEAQTFRDFEIIAVDDGSSDDTAQMLSRTESARLHVYASPGRGIVAALNHAAAHAAGDLLARMDADDIAHPERLAKQVALMDAEPDVVACGTQIRYVPRTGLKDGARRYEAWINSVITRHEIERDLFVECPIPHPTLMVRHAAFPGYREGPFPEDYDLLFRLRGPFAKVPEVLLDWRDSATRLSRTEVRYAPEGFRRLKARYLSALRAYAKPVVVWGAGPVGKAFALELQRIPVPVVAFVDLDPRKVGQRIHGAPVVAPENIDAYRHAYVVAAVGQAGAREEIRAALTESGWRERFDWCAVA
jgi:glycosyltransferase involved in cell wall biosynthesis